MGQFTLVGSLLSTKLVPGNKGDFLDVKIKETRYDPNSGEVWSDYTFSILAFNPELQQKVKLIPFGTQVEIKGVVASKDVTPEGKDTFHSAWLKLSNVEIKS